MSRDAAMPPERGESPAELDVAAELLPLAVGILVLAIVVLVALV